MNTLRFIKLRGCNAVTVEVFQDRNFKFHIQLESQVWSLKETVANLISHYNLPGFGTDSNFPALQTVKNNNKIKESNIMKKFIFFIL